MSPMFLDGLRVARMMPRALLMAPMLVSTASLLVRSSTRLVGSVANYSTVKTIDGIGNDSIYIISLPLTTKRSYVYCHHMPTIFPRSQLKKFPIVTRLESKASNIVVRGWQKMSESKLLVNIKLTQWVRKLLNSIDYEESCLRSFPSKNSMVREVNEEVLRDRSLPGVSIVQNQISELDITESQLRPVPLLHPRFQQPSSILQQLYALKNDASSKHWKNALFCLVGLPLTIPFAIVPVLPNVPGIYVTYRLYCNVKAIFGAKHLGYLLGSNSNHIAFKEAKTIDEIYKRYVDVKVTDKEQLVITPEIIEALTRELPLQHLKSDLLKAHKQESDRIERN